MKEKLVKYKPYLFMAALLLIWGAAATVNKLVIGELDAYQALFYTFLFPALLTPFIVRGSTKIEEPMEKKDWLILSGASVLHFLYYFAYLVALELIPVIEASMINYLFPIMIVLFGVVLFRERMTLTIGLAILLGFVGVYFIATNGNLLSFSLSNPFGDIMALLCAVSWGLFSNLSKLLKKNSAFCSYFTILVSAVLATVALFCMSSFKLPRLGVLIPYVGYSLLSITLTLVLWKKVLNSAPTAVVASMSFLTPFLSLLFIAIFVGDTLSLWQVAGVLLIVLGTVLQSGILKLYRKKA